MHVGETLETKIRDKYIRASNKTVLRMKLSTETKMESNYIHEKLLIQTPLKLGHLSLISDQKKYARLQQVR